MTSNQINKMQADAASENAAANTANAITNRKNYQEDVRHNKKTENLKLGENIIKGVETGGKILKDRGNNIFKAIEVGSKIIPMINDADWYTASGRLLQDTCSRSFNSTLGTGYAHDIALVPEHTIPGIMNIFWSPVIPVGSTSDALNKSAYSLYAYIRYANAGSRNYTAADLMQYLLAMDSIYCLYAECAKYYGMSRKYSAANRYLPDGLGASTGFFNNLRANPAGYRARLNLCAKYINSWYVPAKLSLYTRHMFMSSQIYADADSEYAQLYNFVLRGYWQFKETSPADAPIPGAGSLEYKTLNKADATAVLTSLETAIDRLLRIEDIGIMSGDILKVYGADVFKVNEVDENYSVPIVYHTELLTQIENMTIVGDLACAPYIVQTTDNAAGGDVTEFDLTWFNSKPTGAESALTKYNMYTMIPVPGKNATGWKQLGIYRPMEDLYANLDDKHLSAGDVMVATRLMAQIASDYIVKTGEDGMFLTIDQCGTELVHGVDIVYYDITNKTPSARARIHSSVVMVDFTGGDAHYNDDAIAFRLIKSFDWCPQVLEVAAISMSGQVTTTTLTSTQDIKRISRITSSDLKNINTVAFTKEIGLADADARADRAKRY